MRFLKHSMTLTAHSAFIVLSILMFFFSAQVSLTIYIDSSFLKATIAQTPILSAITILGGPENIVGCIYAAAALLTIIALLLAPRVLRTIGNYRATLALFASQTALLLLLAFVKNGLLILPLFVVEAMLVSVLYFNFDIFLERYSTDEHTGVIRGLFLTIGSLSWLLPPMIAGRIVEDSGYTLVYFSGALLLLPVILLLMRYFSDFQDLAYDDAPLLPTRADIAHNPDIWRGLACGFFLHFFYAWMIIYIPILLHDHLGFMWSDIGFMLTLALTPFVLFPSPLGWLADNVLGEKELLILGFLLMSITSMIIPSLAAHHASFAAWAITLFVGRTGASTVESMTEVYFFKHIDGHNAGLMGYFRRMRPLAYIVAPLLASIILLSDHFALTGLFSLLGIIMLVALYFPLRLKDTL